MKKFNYKKEIGQNPFIGFTSFQHFGNQELYSDLIVRPENNMTETEHVECYPIPAYVKQNGSVEGYYPHCSIAYIRILWKEFEPKQGVFNFSFIEDILHKADMYNQTVMFRLMTHSTRESDDVPDWVKLLIDCPKRPEGERVKTSPSSPAFLDLFGNAIRAIGERFDGDKRLAFLDVSMPGAWGEGCCTDMFTKEQIEKFLDIYTKAFKKTMLIGQVIPWTVHYMNEVASVGWRADCIGKPNLTFEHVPSLQAQMPEVWKRGHISFESYWWLGEWFRRGWDIDKIIETTLSWHISSFNAKSLPIPFEWKDKVDYWISRMGYHFVIDCVDVKKDFKNSLEISLCVDNIGVAPIYNKIPLSVALIGKKVYEFQTNVDITKWIEGKYLERITLDLPNDLVKGRYKIGIGIFNQDFEIYFATNAKKSGKYYIVDKIKI